jgi:hypothetical protein
MFTMRRVTMLLCFIGALLVVTVLPVFGQSSVFSPSSSAAASGASAPSGRPSAFTIKQNFLAMQIEAIGREIRDAERCVANATNPVTLRDTAGNINRVPQTDALDCGRRLGQLTRQLQSLQRKADALARDAEQQAAFFDRQARDAVRKARTQSLNPRSSGGM